MCSETVHKLLNTHNIDSLTTIPPIEDVLRIGTQTHSPTLQTTIELASDLDGGTNNSTQHALKHYEDNHGINNTLLLTSICNAWQENLYCNKTAPLFQAVFDTPVQTNLSHVNPPWHEPDKLCNQFNQEIKQWKQNAVSQKVNQDKQLFKENYGTSIILYRGLTPHYNTDTVTELTTAAKNNTEYTHTANPLTSWTINPHEANQYASMGVVLEREFTLDDIILVGTFNTLPNSEFIVKAGTHTYKPQHIHHHNHIHNTKHWFHKKLANTINNLQH